MDANPDKPSSKNRTRVLESARRIQFGMLPKKPQIEGLQLEAQYEPCDEVSGDFYDFIALSPFEVAIVVGDVSGHGVDAGMIMVAAKKTLQFHARRAPSPRDALILTCQDLADDLPNNRFVSIFLGMLDVRTGLLRYASAGHMPPLYLGKDDDAPRELPSTGSVIGALLAQQLEKTLSAEEIQLQAGDTLLLYTDGVNEAENKQLQQYTTERMAECFADMKECDLPELVDAILQDVDAFRAGAQSTDDLTLVALRFVGTPAFFGVPTSPVALPVYYDQFVGRETDLSKLDVALQPGRMVAITGSSGMGKTRLAVQAASMLASRFAGGAYFAFCAQAETVDGVALYALRAMGCSPDADPWAQLGTVLEARGQCLLVLDDLAIRTEGLETRLQKLREAAPQCALLVTAVNAPTHKGIEVISLRPLELPREQPKDPDGAMQSEAMALFVSRARKVVPGFRLLGPAMSDVFTICRALEGVPLALELAAARMQQQTLPQIADNLRGRGGLLNLPATETSATRKLSLVDAVKETWQRLSQRERDLLRGICQFPAALVPEFAAKLDFHLHPGEMKSHALLQSLVDRSLLRTDETEIGPLLRPFTAVRQFVDRELADEPEELRSQLQINVARAAFERAREIVRQAIDGHSVSAGAEGRNQAQNLLLAADLALRIGQPAWVESFVAAASINATPLDLPPCRERLRAALQQIEPGTRARTDALVAMLELHALATDPEGAQKALKELESHFGIELAGLSPRGRIAAARLALLAGETAHVLRILGGSGTEPEHARMRMHTLRGEAIRHTQGAEAGLREFEAARDLAISLNATVMLGSSLVGVALCLNQLQRYAEARAAINESIQLLERTNTTGMLAQARAVLAVLLWNAGDLDEAVTEGRRVVEVSRKHGMVMVEAIGTLNLAVWQHYLGQVSTAEVSLRYVRRVGPGRLRTYHLMYATSLLSQICMASKREAEAYELARENYKRMQDFGLQRQRVSICCRLAVCAELCGESREADKAMAEAQLSDAQSLSGADQLLLASAQAMIARRRGNTEEAGWRALEAGQLARTHNLRADNHIDFEVGFSFTLLAMAEQPQSPPS